MSFPLNITLIARNEEKNLPRCFSSLAPLKAEIVLIDTGSTNRTKEIPLNLGPDAFNYLRCENLNMTGYTTTTGNEMTADAAGSTFSYDKNGGLLSRTDSSGNVWAYTWDYRGRLAEVKETNSHSQQVLDEKLTWDVLDHLVGVNVNGTQQRWTVFDGDNPYLDFNGSGTLVERYLVNPQAIDQFFARVSAGGTVDWYLTDKSGSIREIVDTVATVLDQISYGTFGGILTESNASNGDRFKYDGTEWDSNLALYHMGARWYDPVDGRWISQDPLGLGPDGNPYRFVKNAVTNFTDPTGTVEDIKASLDELNDEIQELQGYYREARSDFFDEETKTFIENVLEIG